MAKADLSAQRLRELLTYDIDTGVFRWAVNRGVNKAGDVAGSDMGRGYLRVKLDGKPYRCNRLAWLYVTGEWPRGVIDHIDGNVSNDRFSNLRDVSVSINTQNQKRAQRHNVTGLLGVVYVKSRGNYVSKITAHGVHHYLGVFATASEAHAAYLSAKRLLHFGCTI